MQVGPDGVSPYEEFPMHPSSVWGELRDYVQSLRPSNQRCRHPPNARD